METKPIHSKSHFFIMRFNENAEITYLCNNNKWTKNNKMNKAKSFALSTKLWNNSSHAWNDIARLVKSKKEKFEQLFVMCQNELTPLTQDNALSFAFILDYTKDMGEIDSITQDLIKEKSNNIKALHEILTELRIATNLSNT
jgi:hypothetical protein